MMPTNASPPKVSVEDIVERIFAFRQITSIDQRLLRSALLSTQSLSESDQVQLNRVFEGLRNGIILVVE
ncbi:hypothetical protein PN499_22920 [Kamptonema animale CS-326]|jgi:hypothetical protein|uniref:hypothetical protein n=1 Tax=Kamptonema animale TaxID=92934 RepID=UPI00232E19B9|nr:hypothetical protein [Kamptonema animale]MDB9514056.1 hypothetical protein [Kamptonema animale CS-326]